MPLSKKVFTALFFISLALSITITFSSINSKAEHLSNVIDLYVERIITQIERSANVTEILKEITRTSEGYLSEEDFYALADAVGSGIDYIAIQFVPDGIVKYSYPLEGNEITIGHNILTAESTAGESQIAMERHKFVLSGPFLLLQGKEGLAIRNPLYLEDEDGDYFWGFITIVLPVPDVLNDTGIFKLKKLGYQYRIMAQYKGEDIVFYQTDDFNENFAQTKPVVIGENNWALSAYLEGEEAATLLSALFMWAAFVLLSYIVYYVIKKLEYKLENDPLTGAYNRRVLEKYIKAKDITSDKKFTLLYIDLNDFKPVNDTYGHEAGDRLLIAYVKRIQANIKGDGIIFRIGGDEFVVIVPGVEDGSQLQSMVSRIIYFSKERFMINGISISVSASLGFASFPSEGKDIKTLLSIADERMYEDKQNYKSNR